MDLSNFAIVDLETTGGSPAFHRIIEVGVLRIERGELVQTYQSLVNPGIEIPEFISLITGITDRDVKNAPTFEDIAEDMFPLFEDAVFVAHNSSFDYPFLKTEFERVGFQFTMDTLCTVRLSRALYPQHKKHNLSALIERFDFECKSRHRAFDDAKVLWDFLQYLPQEFTEAEIQTAIKRTMKKIPPKRQQKMERVEIPAIEYIPEEAGLQSTF